MKKNLTAVLLTGALLLAAAGCGNNNAAETTTAAETNAAETTTAADVAVTETSANEPAQTETTTEENTPAETTADETAPIETTEEAVITTAETDNSASSEVSVINSTDDVQLMAPCTYNLIQTMNARPLTFSCIADTETAKGNMTLTSHNYDDFAMRTYMSDVESGVFILKDGGLYTISDAEKVIYFMTMPEEQMEEFSNAMNQIGINDQVVGSQVETSTADYNGNTYILEKITSNGETSCYYYDMLTGDIKYMVTSGGTLEVLELSNTVDESLFEIPSDYEFYNFDELLAGLGDDFNFDE